MATQPRRYYLASDSAPPTPLRSNIFLPTPYLHVALTLVYHTVTCLPAWPMNTYVRDDIGFESDDASQHLAL